MIKKILLAAMAIFLWISQARAQVVCGSYEKIAAELWREFAETPRGSGVTNNGYLVIVFASVNGSFTVILRPPDGSACFMLSGGGWQYEEPKDEGQPL